MKWSQSLKYWFVPFSDGKHREVKHVLKNSVVIKIKSPSDLALKDIIENDKQDKKLLLSQNINR